MVMDIINIFIFIISSISIIFHLPLSVDISIIRKY